jgi:hypothetical protein
MKKLICAMLLFGSCSIGASAEAGWRWEQQGRYNQYRWTNTNRPSRQSDFNQAYTQLRNSIENRRPVSVQLNRLERFREIARDLIDRRDRRD